MTMQDPLADMLTAIRNAQMVGKKQVSVPASKLKAALGEVLKDEGYIEDCEVVGDGSQGKLVIALKYFNGKPVIEQLKRFSRPGLRQYRGAGDLPRVNGGLGTAILSTSKGVMTDRQARKAGVGGEILCTVF